MRKNKVLLVLAMAIVAIFVITGCGNSTATTTDKKEPVKEAKGLVEQYKESVHYTFFGKMIAKGPSIKDENGEHYSEACMGCHSADVMIDDKTAKVDDFFPGGKYADKVEGITCRVCHKLGGKDGFELSKKGWDTCGQCHITGKNSDGTIKKPVLGNEVHHPHLLFIQGIGVGKVADNPSYKYQNMKDNFACQDCHVMNNTTHTFMVPGVTVKERTEFGRKSVEVDYTKLKTIFDQKKCQSCHKDNAQTTVDNLKKHQEEIGKKLEELTKVKEDLAKALDAQLKEKKADGKAKAYKDYTDAKVKAYLEGNTYFSYVEADSSKGAHNYEFAKKLLEAAEASYTAAK